MDKEHGTVTVEVDDLLLDGKNPRLGGKNVNYDTATQQEEIIAVLAKSCKVLPMAQDCASRGLNRMSRMAVVQEGGSYVVVDGNRRLCALKLLRDLDKVPNKRQRIYFKRAAEIPGAFVPSKVECVFYENRDEAMAWVKLQHGGTQRGKGTMPWGAVQSEAFLQNYPLAYAVLSYGIDRKFLSPEDMNNGGIITAAHRYLSTPKVRWALGIHSQAMEKELEICVPKESFNKRVTLFISDLVNGQINALRGRKVEERERYAQERLGGAFPDEEKFPQPICLKPSDIDQTPRPRVKPSKHSDKRSYVVSKEDVQCLPGNEHKNMGYILQELSQVHCKKNPFAASYLFRAFFEGLCRHYYEQVIGTNKPLPKVLNVIQTITAYMEKNKARLDLSKKEYENLRQLTSKNSRLSFVTLGMVAHLARAPDSVVLCQEWDNLMPVTKHMMDQLAKQTKPG